MKTTLIPSVLSLVVLAALLLTLVSPAVLAQETPQGSSGSTQANAPQDTSSSGGGTTTTHTTTTTWTANPLWIGLGVVVLILVILLIVLASRGGDRTTVIKD